jgi:hypothetical protein
MAWYLQSSIAHISHDLIVSLTASRVSDQIGRSNLQGGVHWKLMMMSRFGRLVSRMGTVERRRLQLFISMGLDSLT